MVATRRSVANPPAEADAPKQSRQGTSGASDQGRKATTTSTRKGSQAKPAGATRSTKSAAPSVLTESPDRKFASTQVPLSPVRHASPASPTLQSPRPTSVYDMMKQAANTPLPAEKKKRGRPTKAEAAQKLQKARPAAPEHKDTVHPLLAVLLVILAVVFAVLCAWPILLPQLEALQPGAGKTPVVQAISQMSQAVSGALLSGADQLAELLASVKVAVKAGLKQVSWQALGLVCIILWLLRDACA